MVKHKKFPIWGAHWKLHVQTLQEVFCYLIFVKGIETLRIFLVRNELLIN